MDQYGGQHFNPNSIFNLPAVSARPFSDLLGQSSFLVSPASWFAGGVGTIGELLRCEIPGCGQGSAQGDGENYQVRDILNPMSQHQQKSPERPNPSIRMMFSSVAKNLDLGSGLNFCFCDDVLFDLAPMEWPACKI